MAVDSTVPSQLYEKMRDFQKFRNSQYARAGLALPATLQAAVRGGNPYAVARQFFPERPDTSGPEERIELLKMKERLLADRAQFAADKADAEMDATAKLAKMKNPKYDMALKAMEFALDHAKSAGTTSVELAKEKIRTAAGAQKEILDAKIAKAAGISPDLLRQAGSLGQSFYEPTAADGTPKGAEQNLKFWNDLTVMLNQAGPNETARAAIFAEVAKGDPVQFVAAMREAANTNAAFSPMAAAALQAYNSSAAGAERLMALKEEHDKEALVAYEQAMTDVVGRKAGTPGADSVVKTAEAFLDFMGAADSGGPEAADALADKVIAASRGLDPYAVDPKQQAAFDDLLNQLDQPEETMPVNIREAKQRLQRDIQFRTWMESQGFTDPDIALRELRKRSNEQRHANRLNDIRLAAERNRAKGAQMVTPKAPPTADAATAGGSGNASVPGDDETLKTARRTAAEQMALENAPSAEDVMGAPTAPLTDETRREANVADLSAQGATNMTRFARNGEEYVPGVDEPLERGVVKEGEDNEFKGVSSTGTAPPPLPAQPGFTPAEIPEHLRRFAQNPARAIGSASRFVYDKFKRKPSDEEAVIQPEDEEDPTAGVPQ